MHCRSVLTYVCCENESERCCLRLTPTVGMKLELVQRHWAQICLLALKFKFDGLNVSVDNWTPAADSEAFGQTWPLCFSCSGCFCSLNSLHEKHPKKFCSSPWPQQLHTPLLTYIHPTFPMTLTPSPPPPHLHLHLHPSPLAAAITALRESHYRSHNPWWWSSQLETPAACTGCAWLAGYRGWGGGEEGGWRFGIGGLCDGNSTRDVNWLCHSNQAAGWQMKCVSFTLSLSLTLSLLLFLPPSSPAPPPPLPSHFSSLSGWRKKRGVHVGALDSNTITFLFSSPACLFYLPGSRACHAR